VIHPYKTKLNAHQKYNQMLNDADAYRRAQQLTGKRPSFFKALFSGFSKVGQTEKVPGKPSEASPAAGR